MLYKTWKLINENIWNRFYFICISGKISYEGLREFAILSPVSTILQISAAMLRKKKYNTAIKNVGLLRFYRRKLRFHDSDIVWCRARLGQDRATIMPNCVSQLSCTHTKYMSLASCMYNIIHRYMYEMHSYRECLIVRKCVCVIAIGYAKVLDFAGLQSWQFCLLFFYIKLLWMYFLMRFMFDYSEFFTHWGSTLYAQITRVI